MTATLISYLLTSIMMHTFGISQCEIPSCLNGCHFGIMDSTILSTRMECSHIV